MTIYPMTPPTAEEKIAAQAAFDAEVEALKTTPCLCFPVVSTGKLGLKNYGKACPHHGTQPGAV